MSQRNEVSHGIDKASYDNSNNRKEEDRRRAVGNTFPIAKIKVKDANNDNNNNNSNESSENNDINNHDDFNANHLHHDDDNKNYFSLKKATQDLLDVNQTTIGNWTKQDCDNVVGVMRMWSKRAAGGSGRTPHPAIQQERLLRRIIEEKQAANSFALDLKTRDIYHDIIFSWSKISCSSSSSFGTFGNNFGGGNNAGGGGGAHSNPNANANANRAEEILDAMQHAYNSGEDRDLQPAIDAWNSILDAYANSKSEDAPEQAMRVINKLYRLISEGKTDARPNDESYASILKAVAGTGGKGAPQNVLDLLVRMQNLSENGFSIDVTTSCHNVYLSALVESMKDRRVHAPQTARLAESHLHKMKEHADPNSRPDRKSYNLVLAGWSKSGDRDLASKAEALLEEMEASTEGGSTRTAPNKYTYNRIIFCYTWSQLSDKGDKALAVLGKMKELGETNPFCRPDYTTYNAVMNCITKGNHPSAPYQVEALLKEMTELFKRTGDYSVRPHNRSFNACVNAWARSKSSEAPERIKSWIGIMQDDFESGRTDGMPNKWTYNSYLQALAKQRKPSSADEAERILSMMEDMNRQFHSNNIKPDVLTYTNVLHCIALSESDDAFQRAYAILSKMESGDGDVRPNVYTYNVLINVVAKSKLPGKAKIAVRLVNRMKQVAIRPIIITYNNALNACAYSDTKLDDQREVMQVATMILKEAQETSGANYISYTTYIRVIRYFVHDRLDQWRLIRKTFRRCCKDGQLTLAIMKQMRAALSAHQYGLIEREATDERTGRWHKEYTRNAKRLKSQPLRRNHSISYK